MPLILVAVLAVVAIMIFFSIASNLLGLILMLVMAGIVGVLADKLVPGELPYGMLGAVIAGLVGSWLGTMLLGHLGPTIFGIAIIPGIIGAAVLAAVVEFGGKALGRPRTV